MKIVVSSFYFIGSAIFLTGSLWYIIDPPSLAVPYLWLICACSYATASTVQLIYDINSEKEQKKYNDSSPVTKINNDISNVV